MRSKRATIIAVLGGAAAMVTLLLVALFFVGLTVGAEDVPESRANEAAADITPTPTATASEPPTSHTEYVDYVRGATDYFADYTDDKLIAEGMQYCDRYDDGADPSLIDRELMMAYFDPARADWASASINASLGAEDYLCPEHHDDDKLGEMTMPSMEFWGEGPHATSDILDRNFVEAQRAQAAVGNSGLSDAEILSNAKMTCAKLDNGLPVAEVAVDLILHYSDQPQGGGAAGALLPTAVRAYCPQHTDAIDEYNE